MTRAVSEGRAPRNAYLFRARAHPDTVLVSCRPSFFTVFWPVFLFVFRFESL